MSTFKFGFSSGGEGEPSTTKKQNPEDEDTGVGWVPCKEIIFDAEKFFGELMDPNEIIERKFLCEMKYFRPKHVIETVKNSKAVDDSAVLNAESNHSDLLPAVYEGGFKIWECSYDLIGYIEDTKMDLNDKKCLDLGCGTGIIGILCYLQGAFSYFQDYNEEVIKYITIPNLMLNRKEESKSPSERCRFYSGDWDSFVDVLNFKDENDKFDIIFSSETIYNLKNYPKLIRVFKNCLKKNGTVYLAAKCYYFGVGGSVSQFEELLKEENAFDFTTCYEFNEGVKRKILKITFKL